MTNIITHIESRARFHELLAQNPGMVIIKFGATWCKPCQIIDPHVYNWFYKTPHNIVCCSLDIDENADLYSYLRSKRMVQGVPTILCYEKGNMGFAPDDSVSGSGTHEFNGFVGRCMRKLQSIR